MSTPTIERPAPTRPHRSRIRYGFAAALVAIVAAVVGIILAAGEEPEPVAAPPLELSLGNPAISASCIPVSVETLQGIPIAFEGTVTELTDDSVTLSVDRWFRGGDADVVRLAAITDTNIMISVVEFEVGEQYLITASEGSVNYCGYSGPATAELRSLFGQAYAA